MVINEAMKQSFEKIALPVANRKKLGVIAMKVFAQEELVGEADPEKLLYYSLSLPVSLAVVGMPSFEHIEQNVALAKAFKPMPKKEMLELSAALSARKKMALDRFFASHIDG
jgi:hypothetical protein